MSEIKRKPQRPRDPQSCLGEFLFPARHAEVLPLIPVTRAETMDLRPHKVRKQAQGRIPKLPVTRGHLVDHGAARRQNAPAFRETPLNTVDMFEHVARENKIERAIAEARKVPCIAQLVFHVG